MNPPPAHVLAERYMERPGEPMLVMYEGPPPKMIRGETYVHHSGRRGVLISTHPHDGALYVFHEIGRADDDIEVYFTAEFDDMLPAKVK